MSANPPRSPEPPQAPTQGDLLVVLSRALDLVGVIDRGHCQRVAVLASDLAARAGLGAPIRERIVAAALLHDIGVSSTHVHDKLVHDDRWSDVDRHCERGDRLLSLVPGLSHLAPIVRRHHSRWQDPSGASIPEEERLAANIVFLADRLDAWLAPEEARREPIRRQEVFTHALDHTGGDFAPELAPALLGLSRDVGVLEWLEEGTLDLSVEGLVHALPRTAISREDVRAAAYVLAAVVDAKCPYTAEHSFRVAAIAARIAEFLGLDADRREEIRLAGLVHDVGKLGVPDDIVNKPASLDAKEIHEMRRHVSYSYDVLAVLPGMERIARFARWHHERVDGQGYPDGIRSVALPQEARILGAADVLQAMAQERAYRAGLGEGAVKRALGEEAAGGHLDGDIVSLVIERFDEFWSLAHGAEGIAGLDPVLVSLCRDEKGGS